MSPFRRALLAYSWAWTEGTGGRPVTGPVVRISIANAEELSLSGAKAGSCADLWLTQWPHLAREGGPRYLGNVL